VLIKSTAILIEYRSSLTTNISNKNRESHNTAPSRDRRIKRSICIYLEGNSDFYMIFYTSMESHGITPSNE
jgi:hypothetical protein